MNSRVAADEMQHKLLNKSTETGTLKLENDRLRVSVSMPVKAHFGNPAIIALPLVCMVF